MPFKIISSLYEDFSYFYCSLLGIEGHRVSNQRSSSGYKNQHTYLAWHVHSLIQYRTKQLIDSNPKCRLFLKIYL
jgi:hypothetical protein